MKDTFRENWILLIILFVGLLVRLAFAYSSNVPWWDESVYLNLGYDLSNNPFDYSVENNGWSDFIPSGGDKNYAWPKMGFRPPLLPYFLAIFYALNLGFLIKFLLPLIGVLTIFLVYLLGKEMFDKKAGLISAAIISLIPIHATFSGRILNDVFVTLFITLAFLFFWKGFERGNKKYKVLWGIFLGLGLLTRYTMLWIIPIFPIYLWIKNKSLSFLRDKYLWYSIIGFFIVLIPWFIYGYFEYGNIFGGFLHGFKGAAYWGGNQAWSFFFQNHWKIFSISGILFVSFLIEIFYEEEYKKKEIYILLIWSIFYLIMLVVMPHKEERFVIPLIPVISLIIGYSLNKIKKYRKIVFGIIFFVLLWSCITLFVQELNIALNQNTECFLDTTNFLRGELKEGDIIVNENPPIVRYFTNFINSEYPFYPEDINEISLATISNSSSKKVYFLFNRLNSGFENEKWKNLKEILDKNYKLEFQCAGDSEVNFVYSNGLE